MRLLQGHIVSTVAAVLMIAAVSCRENASTTARKRVGPPITPPALATTQPANYDGVHNVVTYADGLYSGSVPEGDAGFETLARMGIKTVISVDGAAPDVAEAKKYGMRYVHLPIGYNGMDEERKLELARAVRDLPGPIYLHCHHGKHRSAGAAGAVAVTLGKVSTDEAVARMKVSGTSPEYKGLYMCVMSAKPDADGVAHASKEFPQVYKTSGMVNAMVEMDEAFDHLKAIEKAGWKVPADHPDLVPAAEAGKLADLFRTLDSDPHSKPKGQEFRQWLADGYAVTASLEEGLVSKTVAPTELSARFKHVSQSCTTCHTKYRNND